jgi:hypothetical protein
MGKQMGLKQRVFLGLVLTIVLTEVACSREQELTPVTITPEPGVTDVDVVTGEPPDTITPPTSVSPPDGTSTASLQWEIIDNHVVIDPSGKYWEKYESGTDLPGIYLRMDDVTSVRDFLDLKPDGTFDQEQDGDPTSGTWEVEGNTITLMGGT